MDSERLRKGTALEHRILNSEHNLKAVNEVIKSGADRPFWIHGEITPNVYLNPKYSALFFFLAKACLEEQLREERKEFAHL